MEVFSRKLSVLKKVKFNLDKVVVHHYNRKSAVEKRHELNGVLAQLGEHLPYKQRVTGSSPVGPNKSRLQSNLGL